MMLKRNIKIILVGLFSLLFLGLVYSFFGSQPEIISDDALRVEESIIPAIESQVERAAEANNPQPLSVSEAQIESSLDSDPVEQSVEGSEAVAQLEGFQVTQPGDQTMTQLSKVEPESQKLESTVVSQEVVDAEPAEMKAKIPRADVSNSVSPFRDDAIKQPQQAEVLTKGSLSGDGFLVFDPVDESEQSLDAMLESALKDDGADVKGEVAVIPDSSEFMDLNLDEVEAFASDTVVLEEDQKAVDEFSVAEVSIVKPSVFNMPEIDEELMQGDSEMSKKYRATMNKIISINAKLRDADAENAELQMHFEMAVDQNRQLAQIIRDIDTQIKSFTVTN